MSTMSRMYIRQVVLDHCVQSHRLRYQLKHRRLPLDAATHLTKVFSEIDRVVPLVDHFYRLELCLCDMYNYFLNQVAMVYTGQS